MQQRMAAMQASRGMDARGPGMEPGRPANDDDVIDGEFTEVDENRPKD